MSSTGMPALSLGDILATLTQKFNAAEGAVITAVASFTPIEIAKLTFEAAQQVSASLLHFVNNLKGGMAWGSAMASMLTELWNDTKSDLQQLATDFVDAVGKVFQSVGLITAVA